MGEGGSWRPSPQPCKRFTDTLLAGHVADPIPFPLEGKQAKGRCPCWRDDLRHREVKQGPEHQGMRVEPRLQSQRPPPP